MSAERLRQQVDFPKSSSPEHLPGDDLNSVLHSVAPESFATLPESGDDVLVSLQAVRSRLNATASSSTSMRTPGATAPAEPFLPKEGLDRIKTLPKAERKQALTEFKTKLLARQEAQANYRVAVENILQNHPDTPKQQLLDMLDTTADEHFSTENKDVASAMLDRYYEARRKALEVRAQYPDDKDLLDHLIGEPLSLSGFNVKVGPMSLEIYAKGADVNKLFRKLSPDPSNQSLPPVNGFAATGPGGVNYSLINKESADSKKTAIHEQQHQTNKIFQDTFDRVFDQTENDELFDIYMYVQDPEGKRVALETYFKSARVRAYDRLKDELFAKVSDKAPLDNIEDLFKPGSRHKYYDYLKSLREANPNDPQWKQVSDEMLVKEYSRVMQNAVDVIRDLTKTYSPEKVIAMLSEVPLEDWSKRAARIYQEKLADPEIKAEKLHEQIKDKIEKPKDNHDQHDEHDDGHGNGSDHGHKKGEHGEHGHGGHGHGMSTKEKIGVTALVGVGAVAAIFEPSVVIGLLHLTPVVAQSLAGVGLGGGFLALGFTWLGDVATLGLIGNFIKAAWEERGKLLGSIPFIGGGSGGGKKATPKAANDNHAGGGHGAH